MSALTIDRIAGALGWELQRLDLTRPLTDGDVDALRAAAITRRRFRTHSRARLV